MKQFTLRYTKGTLVRLDGTGEGITLDTTIELPEGCLVDEGDLTEPINQVLCGKVAKKWHDIHEYQVNGYKTLNEELRKVRRFKHPELMVPQWEGKIPMGNWIDLDNNEVESFPLETRCILVRKEEPNWATKEDLSKIILKRDYKDLTPMQSSMIDFLSIPPNPKPEAVKSLEECKDEVAKKYGYKDFKDYVCELLRCYNLNVEKITNEIAELYANQFKK